MKLGRTDRLSPEEREIVDRFERGVIDAEEAGRLLIASVRRATVAPENEPDDIEDGGSPGRDARRGGGATARRADRARRLRRPEGLAPQAFCGFLHFSTPPTHPFAWFLRSPKG